MGYRGKVREQQRARALRAEGWTLAEIAAELEVAKSSVSLWVRDVPFEVRKRAGRRAKVPRRPNALHLAKLRQIEEMDTLGIARIGELSEYAFLVAGTALYAGEGSKTDGKVAFANSDPAMIALFCAWLRHFFGVDEARLRLTLYLHEGLDIVAATEFWSVLTGIPVPQFNEPYRAVPDRSIRTSKHPLGCPRVSYSCSLTHRAVMGLVRALLSSTSYSGVAQLAEQLAVNETAEGSSPSPGATPPPPEYPRPPGP